ncbi:MAG: cyclic nucleotide-binding domain-containing protein [Bauldia sp.]|nr:cyclic nucleotide-binding domain-containing protein [Bauldia sp.]
MDIRAMLADVPLFGQSLDPAQIDALASRARVVLFETGTRIIQENDSGATMYAIVKGSVSVTVEDTAGKRKVATLGPGQIFGEISLLTGLPRLGTVTANEPVEAVEITRDMLRPILEGAPKLYDRLGHVLQKRQGDLDQIVDSDFWAQFGRSRENLAKVMRRNFAEAR